MKPFIYSFKTSMTLKIICACMVMLVALILPAFIIQENPIFESPGYNHLIKAIAVSAIVIMGIWLLRTKLDKGLPLNIGLSTPTIAAKHFLLGIGLIFIPFLITVSLSSVFNWADYTININWTIILSIIIGFFSTFFTDAFSEELIFRGYIFSNLKQHNSIWKSSIITLVIFVITPLIIISIQNSLNIKGSVALSGGYIITLFFFGAFMQYLRITFKSIWVGIGFHLVFVQMNQLMGSTNDRLLQFSENSNQQPIQITLAVCLIVTFASLIIYSFIKSRKEKNNYKIISQ